MVDEADRFVRRTRLVRASRIGVVGVALVGIGVYFVLSSRLRHGTAVFGLLEPREFVIGVAAATIGAILVAAAMLRFRKIVQQPPVEIDAEGHELIPRAELRRGGRGRSS
jgi:drug/metabolite transporter (DMT)-like permease